MRDNGISIPVSGGDQLPSVGLGLWKIENEKTAAMVQAAVAAGYRHIDAACDYGNEREAGEGIRNAIATGLCKRDDLWVTSKLWNTFHRPEHVRPAIERTLADMGLEYLDLYLIHFPISLQYVPFEERYPPGWFHDPTAPQPAMKPDVVPIAETWGAMEELYQAGLCKHVGISNFAVPLIRDLLSYASIRPSVLQVESHPYLVQEKLLRYCRQEEIAYTAFSPLGAGSYVPLGMAQASDSILEQPLVLDLAAKYSKSPAQIVLRWGVQRGTAVIPKTSRPERLVENIALFDFSLSDDEMTALHGLDRHQRFNDPGVFCEAAFGCFYPIYE
ncbi:MAG: aldo/keto reductase [Pirellulaceae bacterium]